MDTDSIPFIPDPATVPPGSKLLVRLREAPTVREYKRLREDEHHRIEIALIWRQKGETYWLVDIERLDPGRVVDAMLLTPGQPFGSVPWGEMDKDEQAKLYWGALQALASRPSFEAAVAAQVADTLTMLALERVDEKPKLVDRLRKTAMEAAEARILAKLEEAVDVPALLRGINVTDLVRAHLRDSGWQGAQGKLKKLIEKHVDDNLETVVSGELDARMGEVFEYLRKGMNLTLNGAMAKLGTPRKVGDNA